MNIAMRRMLPPSRTRRIAKRTGLVVCVVLLGMWAVSSQFIVVCSSPYCRVELGLGQVWVIIPDSGSFKMESYWRVLRNGSFNAGLFFPQASKRNHYFLVGVPFWLLLTLAAVPTAILWRRDRRPKPGCCLTCGYDLRASKKTCPECGTAIAVAKE